VRRSTSGPLSTSFLFTGEQFDAKAQPGQGLYYPERALSLSVTNVLDEQVVGQFESRSATISWIDHT
jgi:hypothetical protein